MEADDCRACMPDFTPPIQLSKPVIPAKAGIQTANAAGTPANELRQHALGHVDIRPKRTAAAAVKPDFYPVAPALAPVIPAKAGIRMAANAVGTSVNELCQHALAPVPDRAAQA